MKDITRLVKAWSHAGSRQPACLMLSLPIGDGACPAVPLPVPVPVGDPPAIGEFVAAVAGSDAGATGAADAILKSGGAMVTARGLTRRGSGGGGRGFLSATSGRSFATISDGGGLTGTVRKEPQTSTAKSTYTTEVRIPATSRAFRSAGSGEWWMSRNA